MNSMWFMFVLFLFFRPNGNFVSGNPQAKSRALNFGGVIARDCNMVSSSENDSCISREVVPILARQYYRLYYFKLICNAINLGNNIIAAPSICFELGIPEPGEYVAVSTLRNWCYNAPERVAKDYTIIVRNNVAVTFAHLIPPLPSPCRPTVISDEEQPEMVKGFDWRSRKTFEVRDSYDGCIKYLPSALLYNRPNKFWGFQHPNCKEPIRIREFFKEFMESNITMLLADTPVSDKTPIEPNLELPTTTPVEDIPTTSTKTTEAINQLEVSQEKIDIINHNIEDLKNKLEKDEQKIQELEHSIDQSIKDNKQVKNIIEDIRDQELDDERWIEDLEKNLSQNEVKLKKLENVIKDPNQNELDLNETMEDLKERLVEDEKKVEKLEHSLQNVEDLKQQINEEENKIGKLEDAVEVTNHDNNVLNETLNKLISRVDADDKKINDLENIIQHKNGTNEKLSDNIDNLKTQLNTTEKKIESLEDFLEKTNQDTKEKIDMIKNEVQLSNETTSNLNDTIKNLEEKLDADEQKIEELKDIIDSTIQNNTKLNETIDNMKELLNETIHKIDELQNVAFSNESIQQINDTVRNFEEQINNSTKNMARVLKDVESNLTYNWAEIIEDIIEMIDEERTKDEARNKIISDILKNVTTIENNKCSKEECQHFDEKLNNYIEKIEQFKENVNLLMKNNNEELVKCKDSMSSTEKKIVHLEHVVHELLEKFENK